MAGLIAIKAWQIAFWPYGASLACFTLVYGNSEASVKHLLSTTSLGFLLGVLNLGARGLWGVKAQVPIAIDMAAPPGEVQPIRSRPMVLGSDRHAPQGNSKTA